MAEPMQQVTAPIKSALFVDFDNIYIGLSNIDPLAAERFASDPSRWLAWLESGLPALPGLQRVSAGPTAGFGEGEPTGLRRRSILIRRCYPNPDAGFRRYRSFFTSSAFHVIDCPSLTRTGKNSSDIYMVMDILDALEHKTHFDEFIILSGDSDFMPVLLRLRAHDRRTTTLAIDFMPPAFRAACDLVIGEEEFIEQALGISQDESTANSSYRARLEMPVLREMAQRVYEVLRQSGEVAGAELPDILKDFREFRESNNWLGFGTSQRLAEGLIYQDPRLLLVRVNPIQYRLELKAEPPASIELPPPAQTEAEPHPAPEGRGSEPLKSQILAVVKEVVANSNTPVLLARVSQIVVNRLGPRVLETQWGGAGSFKKLLQGSVGLDLEISTQPEPGYLFDPARHHHPARRSTGGDLGQPAPAVRPAPERQEANSEYESEQLSPDLDEFARRVSQVTGAPLLTPDQYALVFRGIHAVLEEIALGRKTYNTYQSAKSVSDWCAGRGMNIPHSDIVLVFKGIIYQGGIRVGKQPGSYTIEDVARAMRDNIHSLCQRSRLELSECECRLLDDWIFGGLSSHAASEEPADCQDPKPMALARVEKKK